MDNVEPLAVTVQRVTEAVAVVFQVPVHVLFSTKRTDFESYARFAAIALISEIQPLTPPGRISEYFKRCRTMVTYSSERMRERMDTAPAYRHGINAVRAKLDLPELAEDSVSHVYDGPGM